jgi:hypothetical protein
MPAQGSMRGPVPADPVGGAGPVPPGTPAPPAPGQLPGSGRFRSAWKTGEDGRTTFQLVPPLVLFWIWTAFAAANVADLAIESHDWLALQISIGLVLATGLMFACAFRPKIITDDEGLTVRNPFLDHIVPWGLVSGIYIGDSVEIGYHRPPPKKEKTVYSWALYSPRRARAKAELRMARGPRRQQQDAWRARKRFEVDTRALGRAPQEAKDIANLHASHIMATELAKRCQAARGGQSAEGAVPSFTERVRNTADWPAVLAAVVPAAAFIAVLVAR